MMVCIDTNVVLGIFAPSHPYHVIYQAWARGGFVWCVSTAILLEYDEIMIRQGSPRKASLMTHLMTLVSERFGNLHHLSPSFRFQTIPADADDDKFADCAIAAHADYIITEDRHFASLKGAGFKPQPITPEEFIARHLEVN
jgi:putative PIN family toxin of toxin-antitoxin system